MFLINLPHILTSTWENSSHLHFTVPILKFVNLQFGVPHYGVYHRVTGNRTYRFKGLRGCRHCFSAIFSLATLCVVIALRF